MKQMQGMFWAAIGVLFINMTGWSQATRFIPKTIKGSQSYFRVGKTTEGQWWFITPEGTPFYYKGVCAVNRAGTMGGRRAKPGAYAATIDSKYNYPQSPDAFVEGTFSHLRNHGFNALGAWATEEFFNKGMPFTEIIEFFKEGPFLPQTGKGEPLPDIFSKEWEINADRKTRALCTPLRYSKDLIGYFTDNEIGFGKAEDNVFNPGFQTGQLDFSLLRNVLGMDTASEAHKAAWALLMEKYQNDAAKLKQAWGANFNSPVDFKMLNETKVRFTGEAYEEDAEAFSKLYAEQYFKITRDLIKRYDPNHLIMGCRFGAPPPSYVLDAMKPYTDVISANNYQPILYDRYDTVYRHTGMPILIGEISWNTDLFKKVPYSDETGSGLTLKERMFRNGTQTLRRTSLHDGIVGFTWYRWVQGISTDERFFDGVVNYKDEPDIHSPAHKALVPGMDALRIQHADGAWKMAALQTGEMNLFLDELRPNYKHNLRLEWKDGKPQPLVHGWKMKGKPGKYKLSGSTLEISLEIDFEEQSNSNGVIPAGKGQYQIRLVRDGEKWNGTYTGTYNGSPMSGRVYAFYFPLL
jgi:hypothetical protein